METYNADVHNKFRMLGEMNKTNFKRRNCNNAHVDAKFSSGMFHNNMVGQH